MVWKFLELILLDVGLQGFLKLLKRVSVWSKKTFDLSFEFLRKCFLVLFTTHCLDVECNIEVPQKSMHGLNLLFLNFAWIFLGLVGLVFHTLGLEVLDIGLFDLHIAELSLAENSSLLREILDGGDKLTLELRLAGLGILRLLNNGTGWSCLFPDSGGFGV